MSEIEFGSFRATVEGRVQGVGFRAFAQREAQRLGLNGRVRNLENGTVEVTARGPLSDLEIFENKIKKGPAFSKVTNSIFEPDVAVEDEGFEVIY